MRLTAWQVPGLFLFGLLWGGCPGPGGSGDGGADETPWEAAFDATDVGWLLSVWGSSAEAVYAVGGERAPDGGRAMRYDGDQWVAVEFGQSVPLINWVYGFGPDDVWMAGDGGTVLRFDGASWTKLPTPTEENLWGIWGASPNAMWAVGGLDDQPVILRWDGAVWTELEPPEGEAWADWLLSGRSVNAFFKVWGTAEDNVYIVGDAGTMLQWDGAALTQVETGTVRDLISLWGTGPNRIAAVGGRGNGVIVTYDGTDWLSRELSPLPGLNGVWMGSPGTVHAVGEECTLVTIDFETMDVADESCDGRTTVHAVFGDPSGRLLAVGGNLVTFDGTYRGLALQRDRGADE